MCAGTDNKCVRIPYELRSENLSPVHKLPHRLFSAPLLYIRYFIVDNNFHIQFIFYTHKGNK